MSELALEVVARGTLAGAAELLDPPPCAALRRGIDFLAAAIAVPGAAGGREHGVDRADMQRRLF
ncbi:hypothetical protein NE857_09280 [Nocardiopsis exhalans]|uniref:Uncharacterized protein n=1 Tax=Nocardiopsis exhalans TaxID=163604 RepID=A0ABY5DF02_9ACTN|nr:hypothetical protein [Nocardiopsis exhalans]USY21773.1 hypothetical protein NE857_09280 [Nocardiopsis exhalans]